MDRLLAFGHSRMELNLRHARLIEAAGRAGARSYAAESFAAMHMRYLLNRLGVRGDVPFLTAALLPPLEAIVLVQQTEPGGLARPGPGRVGRPGPPRHPRGLD